MSGDRQSSSEVAHEAEDTRAHLASTLEQLRTNLQPGNVMEEVVSNAKAGAASLADNIADIAKRYPIPSVLIAAGSALAARMFSGRTETGAPAGQEGDPRPLRSLQPTQRDPSGFQPAPGRGGSALPGRATGFRDGVADAAASAAGHLDGSAGSLARYRPAGGGEPRSRLATLFDEQPLILGAIGLAVGAAIGAALPITETEEHVMGATAHRLRDQAADAARHEVDEMRAAAGQAIDNVRQSARDNLKTVVDRAAGALGPEARDV